MQRTKKGYIYRPEPDVHYPPLRRAFHSFLKRTRARSRCWLLTVPTRQAKGTLMVASSQQLVPAPKPQSRSSDHKINDSSHCADLCKPRDRGCFKLQSFKASKPSGLMRGEMTLLGFELSTTYCRAAFEPVEPSEPSEGQPRTNRPHLTLSPCHLPQSYYWHLGNIFHHLAPDCTDTAPDLHPNLH